MIIFKENSTKGRNDLLNLQTKACELTLLKDFPRPERVFLKLSNEKI